MNEIAMKKVYIETWGCQMNVADSEAMLALLKNENYLHSEDPDDADLLLLNTCHIREKAKHKVMSRLGRLRHIKESKPEAIIAVAGCVSQAEGKKLTEQAPVIDVLLGPGKIAELPRLLRDFQVSKTKQMALGFTPEGGQRPSRALKRGQVPASLSGKSEVSRFVNIQQGCDNFCTFCVVPFTRGREVSEIPTKIRDHCQSLVNAGVREITLLGQNVNSYGNDLVASGQIKASKDGAFVELLREVSTIEDLRRLRFTTSNPHDFTEPLARLFGEEKKLGRYIHLPVQSGSNAVLERMRRKLTIEQYWERVGWLRKQIPDIAISTDIIVGFPGESAEDFERTYTLVRELGFSFIFAFKYSPRRGTAAARFRDQVCESEKAERLSRLNALQHSITTAQNASECGKLRHVLFHYASKKEPGIYYGKTEHFRPVRVRSSYPLLGKILPVTIDGGNATALTAQLADATQALGDARVQ